MGHKKFNVAAHRVQMIMQFSLVCTCMFNCTNEASQLFKINCFSMCESTEEKFSRYVT